MWSGGEGGVSEGGGHYYQQQQHQLFPLPLSAVHCSDHCCLRQFPLRVLTVRQPQYQQCLRARRVLTLFVVLCTFCLCYEDISQLILDYYSLWGTAPILINIVHVSTFMFSSLYHKRSGIFFLGRTEIFKYLFLFIRTVITFKNMSHFLFSDNNFKSRRNLYNIDGFIAFSKA